MTILAEISDKIVSPYQFWASMGAVAAVLGVLAFATRSWLVLCLAVPISAVGSWLTLSFLNDPVFGDEMLRENGWPWFASNLAASMLPAAAVFVGLLWRMRTRRESRGFEVV